MDVNLTDEELAEIRDKMQHRPTCLAQPWRTGIECSCGSWERVDRLITALRASRREVRDLEAKIGFNARDPLGQRVWALTNELEATKAGLRASRAEVDALAEALRTCMKDLQEHGVIFAPGDPSYDLLLAYDERVGG